MKQAYSTWSKKKRRREKKKKGKERGKNADCCRLYPTRRLSGEGIPHPTDGLARVAKFQRVAPSPVVTISACSNFTSFSLAPTPPPSPPHISSSFLSFLIRLSLPATNLTQRYGVLWVFSLLLLCLHLKPGYSERKMLFQPLHFFNRSFQL